jgi:hypothetical protein
MSKGFSHYITTKQAEKLKRLNCQFHRNRDCFPGDMHMAKMEANWECNNCNTENWISYNPEDLQNKIYACCQCGKVHGTFKKSQKKRSWLECLPFEGVGKEIPAGVIINAGTREITFADPSGKGNKSRAEYAKMYGWDPLVLYCNIHKDHEICKDFENRCKKAGTADPDNIKKTIIDRSRKFEVK